MKKKEQAYYEIKYRGDSMAKIPLKPGQTFDPNHQYIVNTNKFSNGNKSLVIFHLLDEYCSNIKNSREQWKKDRKPYRCTFTNPDKSQWQSLPINYSELDRYIKRTKRFKFSDFNFPNYTCDWLDLSVDMTMNFHLPSGKMGMVVQDFSLTQRFGIGIRPQLDREGHLISSFLPQLTIRIVNKRKKLIENSDKVLEIDWLFDFKDLINDCISLMDIFLMQFYTKSKYAPESNWTFDEHKIGLKHGRRLMDKISWVRTITGNNLDIEPEIEALNTLRELRNHLNHFDPPSFCASIEEIVEWLNMTLRVATILYKMRKCVGAKMSEELMTFMVQPIVKFEPQSVFSNRVEQYKPDSGYNTSIWR